ncbi:MAG: DEAD/DEAH box helicase [Thermodesulfobacteriota bacterium]
MSSWGQISPRLVSEYINFKSMDPGWKYCPDDGTMFSKQVEGTARLYNLLSIYNIALLADEVGMGKTYQALGVVTLLWKQNPDARILIIAPNSALAANWCDEYESFVKKNYRQSDNIVRTSLENAPVYSAHCCSNLSEIVRVAAERWCHLYIAKTSSFSYVLNETADTSPSERGEMAKNQAAALRNQIPFQFDLLIVDEAHYFRNKNGGSLRVNSAQGFFGGNGNGFLADKVLLLTATPNHSSLEDIGNIVSYFNEGLAGQAGGQILEKIGIRRFRRLAGKNKYQYRKEVADASSFGTDTEAELFFALYQKQLAEKYKGMGGRSFMYGYLEGFESMTPPPEPRDAMDTDESNTNQDPDNTDFRKGLDINIIKNLAEEFKKISGRPPAHPKYNTFISVITDRITAKDAWSRTADIPEFKHLVFTRRIPSVTEITGRVNQVYDECYLKKIGAAIGRDLLPLLKIQGTDAFRTQFDAEIHAVIKPDVEADDEAMDKTGEEQGNFDEQNRYVASRVLDLFTIKKKGSPDSAKERTHAANFRLKFNRPESPYYLFFEPAPDYKHSAYAYSSWEFDKERTDDNIVEKKKKDYKNKAAKSRFKETRPGMPDTLWAIFYKLIESEDYKSVKEKLDALSPEWKEAFAKFLHKGVLHASSALIELYCWYLETPQKTSRVDYDDFLAVVVRNLPNSHLFALLCEATENFHQYAEKSCKLTTVEKVKNEEWRFLNNQNSAAAVTGATQGRENLIKAFNSPFFPNVLIATSVFQEGVNLQFFCRNVHHYGIAWTPGDNEQRVGRVDRLFSLTERRLENGNTSESAYLLSRYPFLKNTLDETQLISFLKKKIQVEDINDRCKPVQSSKEIDLGCNIKEWRRLLRTPMETSEKEDPYPAANSTSASYAPQTDPFPEFDPEDILTLIYCTMKEMKDSGNLLSEYHFYLPSKDDITDPLPNRRRLAVVNTELKQGVNEPDRHQPFFIDLFFNSQFSGLVDGLVYCLRFLTPVTDGKIKNAKFKQLYENWTENTFFSKYPLVKLVDTKSPEFRFCMAVDFPIFIDKASPLNLDSNEVALGLAQLLFCADRLEKDTFVKENQDLEIELHGFVEMRYNTAANSLGIEKQKQRLHRVDTCWENRENCLVQTFAVTTDYFKQSRKDNYPSLSANYEVPLLCFFENATGPKCRFSFPFVDLQYNELQLLVKWLDLHQKRLGTDR